MEEGEEERKGDGMFYRGTSGARDTWPAWVRNTVVVLWVSIEPYGGTVVGWERVVGLERALSALCPGRASSALRKLVKLSSTQSRGCSSA